MDRSLFLPNQYNIHWYTIDRILGRGGFGTTYLAHDNNLDRPVAIKEYLPLQFCDRKTDFTVIPKRGEEGKLYHWGLERFLSEAKTLAKFDHPNIVQVNSFFELNNTAYMVMKFEQGCDLADYLVKKTHMRDQQSLLNMVLPILEGLKLVHESGFIHRDIKPANIYIRADTSPVLLDFGSARQSTPGQSSNMTRLISKSYTPFEQYNDTLGKQGPWTDIYSLSATLYCCITGDLPVDSMVRAMSIADNKPDDYVKLEGSNRPGYSDSFLACIDWALSFREKDRPQSCAQWADALLQSALHNTLYSDNERTVLERPAVVIKPLEKPAATPIAAEKFETETHDEHKHPINPVTSMTVRLRQPKKRESTSLVLVLSVVLISLVVLSVLGYRYLRHGTATVSPSPGIVESPIRTDRVELNSDSSPTVTAAKATDQNLIEASVLEQQIDSALDLLERGQLVSPADNNAVSSLLRLKNANPNNSSIAAALEQAIEKTTVRIDKQLGAGFMLSAENNVKLLRAQGLANPEISRLSKAIDSEKKISAEIIAAKKTADAAAIETNKVILAPIELPKSAIESLTTLGVEDIKLNIDKPELVTVKVAKAVTILPLPAVVDKAEQPAEVRYPESAFDPSRLATLRARQLGKASREIVGNKLRNFVKAMNKMDVRYLRNNSVFDPRTRRKIDGLASIYHASDVVVHDVSLSTDGQQALAKLTIKTLLTTSGTKMAPGPAIGEYALTIQKIEGVWYDISW